MRDSAWWKSWYPKHIPHGGDLLLVIDDLAAAEAREAKLVAAEKVIELMADDCKLTGWNQDTLRVYRAYKEEPK